MLYKLTLVLLLLASGPVVSKSLRKSKEKFHHNSHDSLSDLRWLFEMEGSEKKMESEIENKVCETKDCEIIAKEFLKGMDKSVDPCDNFYDYVCGSYESEVEIPAYSPSWGRFEFFQETVYHRIRKILEIKPEPEDILPVRQAKKWYRSCMNTESMEKKGLKPIESILMQVGGWPMIMESQEWDEDEQSWQEVERHYVHITGKNIFYDISRSHWDGANISLHEGSLPLNDELNDEFRNYDDDEYEVYKHFVSAITKLFIMHNKADISEERISKDVDDVVQFEKDLYKLSRGIETPSMSIKEFIIWYDEKMEDYKSESEENDDDDAKTVQKINFKKVIDKVFSLINYKISDSEKIRIKTPTYFVELTKLLGKTQKRTIVNYIHWHFVSSMLPYTTEQIRNVTFLLKSNFFGIESRQPRWLECTVEMEMNGAAAYAFVQKFFSDTTDKAVREMIENIREEMESQIDRTGWMDCETKELAKEKLKTIKVFLGYPSFYKNRTAVVNLYKGLTIGSNHFDNVLSYRKYKVKKELHDLISEENNDYDNSFAVNPLVVNAYYGANAIELPAADFQPPLFTKNLPRSVNYGIAGVVIGHEIGHAFDSGGIRYGPDGDETNISEKMLESYYKRAECFLDQFNNYYGVTEPDYETTPNEWEGSYGRRTRGENIADSTGLHSVYEAYRKMNEKELNSADNKLPGFEEYTDDQMFFISFAALWCNSEREKFKESNKEMDVHSLRNLRVIGAVSNTNDFAEAFKCPKGSPMNPENKCNIWKAHDGKKSSHYGKSLHKRRKHHRKIKIHF